MREIKVEDRLRQSVRESGGFTRKAKWVGRRGAPDEYCGWPALGRHAWVETKRPLTPAAEEHQLREHKRLRECGELVYVLPDYASVDAFVREMTA